MGNVKILFAASICAAFGGMLVTACSSTSNAPAATVDASMADSGDDGGDAATGPTCSAISMTACGAASGDTCCVDLSGFPNVTQTCVLPSACSSAIQFQCTSASDCSTGQICCGGIAGDASAITSALSEAGADASFDAASLGSGGIGSILGNLMIHAACQPSCMAGQTQSCKMDSECPSGEKCLTPPAPAGLGSFGSMLMVKACMSPDAGAPASDSGAPDSGSATDSGTTDSGSDAGATDSGASTDAPSNG
ncbi:MAG: hypothetical protein ACREJ3_16775 [Polyangiaceae bacterium]